MVKSTDRKIIPADIACKPAGKELQDVNERVRGGKAYVEKRKPDFKKFPRVP
jgi:1,4-dihydroxy-2-naphthoyl-CoA synthase